MKRLVGIVWMVVACLSISAIAWSVEGPALSPGLRVLSDQVVPLEPSQALNVRWASDQTIYLSRQFHGVTEVTLDGKLTSLHQPVPDTKILHVPLPGIERLAVSSQFFLVSAPTVEYGFRPRTADAAGKIKFTWLHALLVDGIDLVGDRLLFLGDPTPRRLLGEIEPGGGIAWLGRLSSHPERDMKPLLFDVAGAPPKSLYRCATLEMGAVRYLSDGSFLVVPGFQDGVHLFSADGTRVRSWKNSEVGLDAPHCSDLDEQQEKLFERSQSARFEFLNRYRVLEDILPLADGPGLLIRSVAGSSVHWTLNVLQGDRVISYPVPVTGDLPYDRLRADGRGSRIVLLRTWEGFGTDLAPRAGHLYVADLAAAVLPATAKEPAK
jgi:hypothetical protein